MRMAKKIAHPTLLKSMLVLKYLLQSLEAPCALEVEGFNRIHAHVMHHKYANDLKC